MNVKRMDEIHDIFPRNITTGEQKDCIREMLSEIVLLENQVKSKDKVIFKRNTEIATLEIENEVQAGVLNRIRTAGLNMAKKVVKLEEENKLFHKSISKAQISEEEEWLKVGRRKEKPLIFGPTTLINSIDLSKLETIEYLPNQIQETELGDIFVNLPKSTGGEEPRAEGTHFCSNCLKMHPAGKCEKPTSREKPAFRKNPVSGLPLKLYPMKGE